MALTIVVSCCSVPQLYKSKGQQQSKMASKISRSQDFIGISGFLWDFNSWISMDFRISMGSMGFLWDYFRILRK